ncbi:tetratricopeptide repeat protein [Deinococcus sp. HMF7620]|uniref:Tetratricopeptide repeat protein n=1 Tax=Deinococcus arboris TaxID=2682977 RepID=A0A7C9I0K1_9DEIO|nr:tetratricopeptide repeat protein [Deinococcus arboris]MVN88248.1 tetratricopeptide repeat protein [Deinococcus arboris]
MLLLAYLALEGERDRSHLAGLFFGQNQDPSGSLRTAVQRLRRAVPEVLVVEDDRLSVRLDCDAREVLRHLDAGQHDQALELYMGPFLTGTRLQDLGVELEEWMYATREYLARRVRGALLTLAERTAGRGEISEAGALAERAAWLPGAPEPEAEDYQRLGLLLTAARSTRLGRLRQQASDFGLSLDFTPEVAQATLRPLGMNSSAVASALPQRGTSFVGRVVERGEMQRALVRPEVRLLTVVGPGGIGKTRLVLEVARTWQAERDVAFISLEAVSALSTLPTTIAVAIGVTLPADQPSFEALLAVLKTRRLLLVLDSAEHLLEGAPALSRLLSMCPDMKLLVTSREQLGIEEEWVLTIGGLSVPADSIPFENARQVEAVDLFVQRARRARLDFVLTPAELFAVVQVCRLVGGSPLGIELAAAWVKLMPVAEIASEVERSLDLLQATHRDVLEKHSSVRAVFDQTWAQLTETERAVLARLSVFRGGFTREAAAQVAGTTIVTLSALVNKSLVRLAEHGRSDLHVLLLQFAGEELARQRDEEQRTMAAHGAYVFDLCQQVRSSLLYYRDEKLWLERAEQDIDNIRVALNRWLIQGEVETALQCIFALRNFWINRGRLVREARTWFARILSSKVEIDPSLKEQALGMDGLMAMRIGEYESARQQLGASLALSKRRGEANSMSLLHLGIVHLETGDLQEARLLLEQAILQFRSQDNASVDALILNNVGAALNNLGNLLMLTGEFQAALSTFEEALRAKQASGGTGGNIELILANIGEAHLHLGHWDLAQDYLLRAIEERLARGYHHGLTTMLKNLALVMIGQHHHRQAAILLGLIERQKQVLDTLMSPADQAAFEQQLVPLHESLPQTLLGEARAQGQAMTLREGLAYALGVGKTS